MGSEPSAYKEVGLNGRIASQQTAKRKGYPLDRGQYNLKGVTMPGHDWRSLDVDFKGNRLKGGKLLFSNTTLCRWCGHPKFVVETLPCLARGKVSRSARNLITLEIKRRKEELSRK